jgi:hypothetical protein
MMVENLAVESTKCKFDRLSRSDRRLVGWVKYRLSKSSKPWIQLCLPTFCKTTGIGLRTARRSLQKIRQCPQTEIVARTINEAGRWQILVSSSARLYGLKRAEPFTETADGAKRVVKEQIRGKEIKEQQLFLGADPALWKAKSNDSLITNEMITDADASVPKEDPNQMIKSQLLGGTQDSKFGFVPPPETQAFPSAQKNHRMHDTHAVKTSNRLIRSQEVGGSSAQSSEQRTENPCAPNSITTQTRFANSQNNNVWTQNTECHFWDRLTKRGFSKEKQRSKHGNADFGVKTRNLAWFIARNDLRNEHWDNCKVKHTMRHGFTFALQELRRGCNRQTIVKSYSMALHEIHAVAVDAGVTEEASWPPSSTISRARQILIDGECRGKWWTRISNQRKNVLIAGNSQSTS